MPTPSPEEIRAYEALLPITYAPEELGAHYEASFPIVYAPESIGNIRKRPGMYVGDTSDGSALHHLIWELLGNSIDHHLAGQVTRVDLTLRADGSACLEDDGPGIPVTPWADSGLSFLEVAVTAFHYSATLDNHYPHAHVGLSGAGLVAVSALSERFVIETVREGRLFGLECRRGLPIEGLTDLGPTDRQGTRITFWPDPTILVHPRFDHAVILERFRDLSLFMPRLTLGLRDERTIEIRTANGLLGMIDRLRAGHDAHHEPLSASERVGAIDVSVALQWLSHARGGLHSFANLQKTPGGGTHVSGLLDAIAEHLPPARPPSRARRQRRVPPHLLAVVSVVMHDTQYAGPTKNRLCAGEAREAVRAVVSRLLSRAFAASPALVDRLAR